MITIHTSKTIYAVADVLLIERLFACGEEGSQLSQKVAHYSVRTFQTPKSINTISNFLRSEGLYTRGN